MLTNVKISTSQRNLKDGLRMMEYFAPVALHQDLQVSAAIKIVIVGKQFALKVPWDHG